MWNQATGMVDTYGGTARATSTVLNTAVAAYEGRKPTRAGDG